MALVHAIKPLPWEVTKRLHKINAVRNALAHSFFPENRKEYRRTKMVLYNGDDIHRLAGLKAFREDTTAHSKSCSCVSINIIVK
jgi:hypothetical protein